MAKDGSEGPGAVKGSVGRDRDGGEAHDDVRHRHVHQVHPGVHPQLGSSLSKMNSYTFKNLTFNLDNIQKSF